MHIFHKSKKKIRKNNIIDLGALSRRQLRVEFNTSKATVINALSYKTNSYLADKIRTRAKELLLEESEKINLGSSK